MSLRCVLLSLLAFMAVEAQIFGRGGARADNYGMSQEEADHMRGTPQGGSAVDRAMKGWDDLAANPESMQEVLASFKDPEVIAKAKEMLDDPDYMRAAKKKLAEMQAKAQQQGLLDENGQPIPGAAAAAGKALPAAQMLMQQMMVNAQQRPA